MRTHTGERVINIGFTLLIIIIAGAIYIWNMQMGDPSPDSVAGYSFAFAGTGFMLLAAIRYSLYRRARKRGVGTLHSSLNWHISFAIIALVLLFMHSFGNFNPRSGTYALYGMVALAISGFFGRVLDRILPRAIARQVSSALTERGEDRIESITNDVRSKAVHNSQMLHATRTSASQHPAAQKLGRGASGAEQPLKALQTSWDLAYISLEETPQEVKRDSVQYRFVPDRKSKLLDSEALMPGVNESITELQSAKQALYREQLYRYMIRYWRAFHVALALLTVGLLVYHVVYALQLLIPVWLHH